MKVKRILSALLTLSLLLSCICIFASAESESYTGVYNGYNYYTSASITRTNMRAYLSYADSSARLEIRGTYVYENKKGNDCSDTFFATAKTSALGQKIPEDLVGYVSMTANYYIKGTNIQTIHVGV